MNQLIVNVGLILSVLSFVAFIFFGIQALRPKVTTVPAPTGLGGAAPQGLKETIEAIAKLIEAVSKLADSLAKAGPAIASLVASLLFYALSAAVGAAGS